jgi:hypothetical protein
MATVSDKTAPRRVFTGDRLIDEAQQNGRIAIQRQNKAPLMGAVLIDAEIGAPSGTGLSFTSGAVRSIAHGLGRRAVGFIETYGADVPSAAIVGLFATSHPAGISSDTHVTVKATNTGTCSLLVF